MTAPALNLEKRTELNGGSEYSFDPLLDGVTRLVKVRNYGDDLIEVGYSALPGTVSDRAERDDDEKEKERKHPATKYRNLMRSVRRSKAQVRRKCMAGSLDYLLTLTYKENMQDVGLAYVNLTRFIRLVRERYPDWGYCVVHEFQKRGAVHFHLAVAGWQDLAWLRKCWYSAGDGGNCQINYPKENNRGSAKWSVPRLASYISKYITKSATAANGRQRYRVSEGIEISEDTFIMTIQKGRSIVAEVMDSFGVNVAHHWFDDRYHHGWACSWET